MSRINLQPTIFGIASDKIFTMELLHFKCLGWAIFAITINYRIWLNSAGGWEMAPILNADTHIFKFMSEGLAWTW